MASRPFVRTLVAGALAFALVAAAASGTAFTVNTVQGVAVASAATGSLETHPCTGAYDIRWSVSSGEIVGVRAVRLPTSLIRDFGLEYCLDMPYAVLIAERDAVVRSDGSFDFTHDDWSVEWTGVTHPVNGSIDASSTLPASAPLVLSEGMAVQLAIGPDPLDPFDPSDPSLTPVAGPPSPDVCEDVATGGVIEVVTIGGEDFCVHQFLQTGTATFEVVATSSLDVEYLVVGGGGGGGLTRGGGGGAGRVVTNVDGTPLTLPPGEHDVTVGASGVGGGANFFVVNGQSGAPSSFAELTARGGSGGGAEEQRGPRGGLSWHLGGDGGDTTPDSPWTGAGNPGGAGSSQAGGGGAGDGAAGSDASGADGGDGGTGTITGITGTPLLVAVGGGGGGSNAGGASPGGGAGGAICENGSPGTSPGSGGGGGGAFDRSGGPCAGTGGGDGAPGLVVVRYRAPS